MVKFVEVNPAEIDTSRSGRRGTVSYPIIKGFMELNKKVVKLDLSDTSRPQQYLRAVLQSYIKSHNLPIKLFAAGGDLHLMRLDLNNDGTPNENYKPDSYNDADDQNVDLLTPEEVAKRI